MKYHFTLFFAALIISNTNAQTYPWLTAFYNEIPQKGELFDSSMAANNYHSRTNTLTQFNKKGVKKKGNVVFTFQYDDGFMISKLETNTKNKKTGKFEYFIKDSVLMGYKFYKNNKLERDYEITRNSKKKITDLVKKNGKGEVVLKQHNEFDESINMLTRVVIYGKNNREKKAIEYTYFDGKNMKQAKEYKNGKLKRVWNYTCDPKGADEKKVKEMKVCKNVNVDESGNRVESNRIVNPKGEVELCVSTFGKNDKMIKQLIYDDIKHRLKSEWSYLPDNGNYIMTYKSYNKRKQEIYFNKAIFNGRQRILSNEFVFGLKKKNGFKNIFEYSDKSLITYSASFDNKNRKTHENIHTYN